MTRGTLLNLPHAALGSLLAVLRQQGYNCIGPVVRDGAIVYRRVHHVSDLPYGWHDEQMPGTYRLERSNSPRAFSWAVGPEALKPLNFASGETLWRAERNHEGQIQFEETLPAAQPTAVIGVRACDLAALQLQDQHFLDGPYRDPYYAARREQLFLVAVHCTHPADTCFCASTGDGPQAEYGFDIEMYESEAGFLVAPGSAAGEAIVGELQLSKSNDSQRAIAEEEVRQAARKQTRTLPSQNLRDKLLASLDHPHWQEVAKRCLSCGNCSSVCPTCFCHTEHDNPALDGRTTEHVREWSSCFTAEHGDISGKPIRVQTHLRYRQWLTHKLGSWHDQYGRSGCVGCGRCITWCPVGIDITKEAAAIYEAQLS